MRKRIQRPSPALVVASLALFVALGGVGYAAATIGTADIKNSAVTGKKIKNRTITKKDINHKTVKSLRGKRGPAGPAGSAGPAGATGATGATGARGPSDAFQAAADGPIAVGASETTVLTLALPAAGSYVITSKLYLSNNFAGDTFVRCQLSVGSEVDASSTGSDDDSGEDDHRTMGNLLAVTTDAPASAMLSCQHFTGGSTTANDVRIVAIQVGSLTG